MILCYAVPLLPSLRNLGMVGCAVFSDWFWPSLASWCGAAVMAAIQFHDLETSVASPKCKYQILSDMQCLSAACTEEDWYGLLFGSLRDSDARKPWREVTLWWRNLSHLRGCCKNQNLYVHAWVWIQSFWLQIWHHDGWKVMVCCLLNL